MTTFESTELLELYANLDARVATAETGDDAISGVAQVALSSVPGIAFASITRARDDHFQTLAPTDPAATSADQLQYALGSGPCLDSVGQELPVVSGDIGNDPRYPEFGKRVADEFGVRSVLAVCLVSDAELTASLNLYSREQDAFDERAEALSLLLARHAGVVLSAVLARERLEHMRVAVDSNRRIGTAVGVLMTSRRITAEQSFDLLRRASQNTNRRVAAIVEDVIETGELTS